MSTRSSYPWQSHTAVEECVAEIARARGGAVATCSEGHVSEKQEVGKGVPGRVVEVATDADGTARYQDRGFIGRGGMGEVRRVFDARMNRCVAMKILAWELIDVPRARMRFLREARLTASLEHPGVIPVYDRGKLPDGRLWYTMREVEGAAFSSVIAALHSGPATSWNLRRALRLFHHMCEAVAYAHSCGIVHRDLKPDNLMVGRFGEALVVDWGLAKRMSVASLSRATKLREQHTEALDRFTRPGTALGTPGYMAPEQRNSASRAHPTADVYSLGAILCEIATGRVPTTADAVVVENPRSEAARSPMLDDLVALARDATAKTPAQRQANAGVLAKQLHRWLEYDQKSAYVERLVSEADEIGRAWHSATSSGAVLRDEAHRLLSVLRTYDAVEKKLPIWKMLDDADNWDRQSALAETRWFQRLGAALNVDPDSSEAHRRLASHYADRLLEAERLRESAKAAQYLSLLKLHDRGEHSGLLAGRALLALDTEPVRAGVVLYRHVEDQRRAIAVPHGSLGITPLSDVALEPGSYLVELHAPGHHVVRLPICLDRNGRLNRTAPNTDQPRQVRLPKLGVLEADDVFIPAGWFRCGGDQRAVEPLSMRDVWVDDFVMQRFAVTHAHYLEFLNALVARGQGERAVKHAPRFPVSSTGAVQTEIAYQRDAGGCFELLPPSARLPWTLEQPVTLVTWHDAVAYAVWQSERTGYAWRLPNELEWEKAARGVDGRLVSWGDYIEPTYAAMIGSHDGVPTPLGVHSYPEDVSPYGVRGLVGNVREWCANEWTWDGPAQSGERLNVESHEPDVLVRRSVRGGCWAAAPDQCRAAGRFAMPPGDRLLTVGFRLVRTL